MQAQVTYTRKQFLLCFVTMLIALVVIMADRKPTTKVSPLVLSKAKNTATVLAKDTVVVFRKVKPSR